MSKHYAQLDAADGRASWSAVAACDDCIVAGDVVPALRILQQVAHYQRYVGFFHYDVGGAFEQLPRAASDDLDLPLFAFMPTGGERRAAAADFSVGEPQSNFSRDAYLAAVQRAIDYIHAGDVFQVNLSQRLTLPFSGDPLALYHRLPPSQFGAYFDMGEYQILCNSPELFLRVEKLPDGRRRIVNRPIKGTRPNLPGMVEALRYSNKDKAELAMIIDLQRNDLGRICEIGSVRVTQPREIEQHPTVLHGVATIEGILRDGVTLIDILRATFPCGSVTGCPKIRAMEIIDELEPVRRGVYCGALGWIEKDELELSVAIRTMTIKNGTVYVPVGGGIVADSSPAAEYDETLVKARAMLAALGKNF